MSRMKLTDRARRLETNWSLIKAYFNLITLLLHQFGCLSLVACLHSSLHKADNAVGVGTRDDNQSVGQHHSRGQVAHHQHHHSRNNHHQRHHRRNTLYAELQSRINSSESLSSSWFYQQDQPAILDQCCACDEAKYELVFEGLWSKYTHPDDFPENYWLAYFSDIIGASHSNDFQMWAKDSMASDGVKELAELGSTKKLESELKHVSSKTRTIIKARELRYPTLNSKTSAVFRTDKHHHLVSILSKLGPSPDWMVGVSSLELCQLDCTWAAQRVVNLYLWDAGTDSGSSFTSSDAPTQPQERIHPYQQQRASTSSSQFNGGSEASSQAVESQSSGHDSVYAGPYGRNQPGSNQGSKQTYQQSGSNGDQSMLPPVVDDMGQPSSSSGYQTNPTSNNGNNNNNNNNNYRSTSNMQQDQMKPFARLTVTRQRIYEKSCNGVGPTGYGSDQSAPQSVSPTRPLGQLNQHHHHNHHHPTINSDTLIEPMNRPSYSDCRFTDWSDWSSCSSNCGKGIRTRTRSFLDDQAHLAGCSQSDLIEKEICLAECIGNTSCVTRDWSDWSKCSVSCGQGYKKRTRAPIGHLKQACASLELAEMEQCSANDCDDQQQQQQSNGQEHQSQTGGSHCAVTEWSGWSECSVACGKGTKIRTRQFVRKDDVENCSSVKLLQKQSCNGRPELCKQVAQKNQAHNQQNHHQQQQQHNQHQNQKQTNYDLPVIDCKLSNWSPWSTCSALCGNGRRSRSRYIIQMPQNGGKQCDRKLTRTQKCKDLPPCPQDYLANQDSNSNSGNGDRNVKANHQQSAGSSPASSSSSAAPSSFGFGYYRTTTTTTPYSSMMDDEDDEKFSRSLKGNSGSSQSSRWTPIISYMNDQAVAASTEMELLGSSSFQIRNGYVYPFGDKLDT